jgi:hypothetical protein
MFASGKTLHPPSCLGGSRSFLQGGIASLKQIKRGPKAKEDPATLELRAEHDRTVEALLETTIKLQAMKKRFAQARGPPLWPSFEQDHAT